MEGGSWTCRRSSGALAGRGRPRRRPTPRPRRAVTSPIGRGSWTRPGRTPSTQGWPPSTATSPTRSWSGWTRACPRARTSRRSPGRRSMRGGSVGGTRTTAFWVANRSEPVVQEHLFGAGWWGCDCARPEDRSGFPADPREAGGESYLSTQARIQEPLARKAQGQPDTAEDPDWRPDHQRVPGPQDRSVGCGVLVSKCSFVKERFLRRGRDDGRGRCLRGLVARGWPVAGRRIRSPSNRNQSIDCTSRS